MEKTAVARDVDKINHLIWNYIKKGDITGTLCVHMTLCIHTIR